jgi:hypothetical protein
MEADDLERVKVSSYEDTFALFPDTEVLNFKYYGDYQGKFLCKIKHKGEELYIYDYYGSCSGCDAFQDEFDYVRNPSKEKVIEFARSYVESAMPKEHWVSILSSKDEWDSEAKEALEDLLNDKI